jgi:hypothetical protein
MHGQNAEGKYILYCYNITNIILQIYCEEIRPEKIKSSKSVNLK